MRHLPRNNQAIIAHERFARGADTFLAIGCERQFGGAGVAAVEGPFCFAVADYEGAGGCHVRLEG